MIQDILEAREERVNLQLELQKNYQKPLLTHRVNTPGKQKNTPVSQGIFDAVEVELNRRFSGKVLAERKLSSAEGPVMIRVMDMTPEVLKTEAIAIEDEHPLGRFVDLDVYDSNGISLSRSALGYGSRSCYLCHEPAHVCARAQRHRLEELLAVLEKGYRANLNE